MSGRQLAAALMAIALLTFVLPPLAARQVHQSRIAQAQQDAQTIAELFAASRSAWIGDATRAPAWPTTVFAGPGATPKFAPGAEWPEGRTMLPAAVLPNGGPSLAVPPDPWGNQYFIAVDAGPGGRVLVVSAGPNGIIETPHASSAAQGDDVGVWYKRTP